MFTVNEILNSTYGILINQNHDRATYNDIRGFGVSIDSREIKPNEIFLAIAGDNFNGHDYIQKAVESKAAVVICEADWAKEHAEDLNKIDVPIIAVENTVSALATLARIHRKKFNIPVIAVTGSNGKTTTKDMIACVLDAQYKVLKSKASFNNHIGVPLTLLELDSTYQVAVIEMGMNHKGEIRGLASIACPDIGIITNAANAHLEFFDSVSDIIEAKCELLEQLGANSIALVNADCKKLYARVCDFGIDMISFGITSHCTYKAENIITHSEGIAFTVNEKYTFSLNILGEHNVYNALAAIVIGLHFKIDHLLIREQLLKFRAVSLRMQTVKCLGIDMIVDCYNANPTSMKAAIKFWNNFEKSKPHIAILGDMLELGVLTNKFHKDIWNSLKDIDYEKLITVGEHSIHYQANDHFINIESLIKSGIYRQFPKNSVILLKASRAIELEKIIKKIIKRGK